MATPTGGHVAEQPLRALALALGTELGLVAAMRGLAGLSLELVAPWRRRWWQLAGILLGAGYAVVAEIDAHLRRWLGLRLNVVFSRQFLSASVEPGFWRTLLGYLGQDALALFLSSLMVGAVVVSAGHALVRGIPAPSRRTSAGLLVLAAVAFASTAPLVSAVRKWALLAPVPFVLVIDGWHELRSGAAPPDAGELATFRAVIGNPNGSDAAPAWRSVRTPDTATAPGAPDGERWDVVLIAIESLRGWFADFRSPHVAERVPALTALFRERGVAFVHSHSNGYPSGEGNMNLHLGVWSHPWKATANDHLAVRTRALPELLGQAGYHRVWVTGSDPTYDNLQHFMGRWFDHWEVVPGGDRALGRRLIQLYDAAPAGVPRFFSVYTSSTHPPYSLPAAEGPSPAEPELAYLRALAYADQAIGEIVAHIKASGRWNRTLFVVTGDHAQPSAWHRAHDQEVGLPNAGRTWTGLLVAAAGFKGGTIRTDAASHVDVPPTILGLLGLHPAHHFLGRDLFRDPPRPEIAVFDGGISIMNEDSMIVGPFDGDGPLTKTQYDEGPVEDPLRYQHGRTLRVSPADEAAFHAARSAVRAYAWLIDHDRLVPPHADRIAVNSPSASMPASEGAHAMHYRLPARH